MISLSFPVIVVAVLVAIAIAGIKILQEYERGVVFRLGRYAGVKEAGIRFIIPGVDRMVRISLREIVMDVPTQEVITRDNVSVKVNAVLYFRVLHPENGDRPGRSRCGGAGLLVSRHPGAALAPRKNLGPPSRPSSAALSRRCQHATSARGESLSVTASLQRPSVTVTWRPPEQPSSW